LTFDAVYEAHFGFVWRTTRALGGGAHLDDLVQEIFLIVHKKLPEFEGRSSIRTWLFTIVRRVLAHHRRSARRKPSHLGPEPAVFDDVRASSFGPDELLERAQALGELQAILGEIDKDKREALVLVEIEQMTLAEAAEACGTNPNTLASRLRAARRAFEQILERRQAKGRSAR
jgi:RNA polymerase sigma-70 factor (ECF subfamily)